MEASQYQSHQEMLEEKNAFSAGLSDPTRQHIPTARYQVSSLHVHPKHKAPFVSTYHSPRLFPRQRRGHRRPGGSRVLLGLSLHVSFSVHKRGQETWLVGLRSPPRFDGTEGSLYVCHSPQCKEGRARRPRTHCSVARAPSWSCTALLDPSKEECLWNRSLLFNNN